MRATTGRAISASIHQRLRDALARGEPLTYQELADLAGCTVRSVRNYLARPTEIFGFPIERSRDENNRVVVRANVSPDALPGSTTPTADPFQDAFLQALFPAASTDATNDHRNVVVAFRGMPRYSEQHAVIARRFLQASTIRTFALRLRLRDDPADLVLWPIGVVVHNLSGVVLVGLPYGNEDTSQLHAIELSRILDDPNTLEQVPGTPCSGLEDVVIEQVMDLPFCACLPDASTPMTDVHVRFDPSLTNGLRDCIWHHGQRVVLRRNGELDVRFGPVPLHLAASWAASFGAGVRVLGGKKLRKAIKKGSFLPW
jgi:hypothetical protein